MRLFNLRAVGPSRMLLEDAEHFPVPIVNFDRKYVFYWSAKSGCTQATKAVLEDIGLDRPDMPSEYETNEPNYVDDIRNTYYRKFSIDISNVYECSVDKSYVNIKVVRNPFDRVVSSFVMLMRDYIDYGNDKTGILEEAARFTNVSIHELSYVDFCRYLKTKDCYDVDWHIQVQAHPFETKGEVTIDECLKLESLQVDLEQVKERRGIDISVEKNSDFHHHNILDEDILDNVSNVPFLEYAKNIPVYRRFYNAEVSEVIRDKYRDDFRLYGYRRDAN